MEGSSSMLAKALSISFPGAHPWRLEVSFQSRFAQEPNPKRTLWMKAMVLNWNSSWRSMSSPRKLLSLRRIHSITVSGGSFVRSPKKSFIWPNGTRSGPAPQAPKAPHGRSRGLPSETDLTFPTSLVLKNRGDIGFQHLPKLRFSDASDGREPSWASKWVPPR